MLSCGRVCSARFSWSGRLVGIALLGLMVPLLTSCVPFPKFQEAERKLAVANKVNRDLDNRLKAAAVELTAARGGENMRDRTFEALNAQLENYRLENDKLQEEVDKVSVNVAHHRFLAEKYKSILAKVCVHSHTGPTSASRSVCAG